MNEIPRTKFQNPNRTKPFELDERTFLFAKDVADFCNKLRKNPKYFENIKQLTRSSGSVGANYIEANESLGKKDFFMHIKISKKEAKESAYWLRLIVETSDPDILMEEGKKLQEEANELKLIFSSILEKAN